MFFSAKPTLQELNQIEANGKTVRIIDTVAAKWESIAIGLNIEHKYLIPAAAGGNVAAVGAGIGTVSGLVLGPVGTVLGATVGGLMGGLVGSAMGIISTDAVASSTSKQGSVHMVFSEWLEGKGRKPITWATLIMVLKDSAEFSKIAHDLEIILSKIGHISLIIIILY